MINLSNTFGWNYFADWSSEKTLKNFPAVNIETAIGLAWEERYAWRPFDPALQADPANTFNRNFTTVYGNQGIAHWWMNLIPHVRINGKYVIYDGETRPAGSYSGYGWRRWAVKGDTIPNLMPLIGNNGYLNYVGSGYIPDFIPWPYALTVAEMEELIGENILPYPYNRPLASAEYYLQFYKILNAVRHRLYYAAPSNWFTGLTDNTWSGISAAALAELLAQSNIYSVYIYRHKFGDSYDVRLKTVGSGQIARYSEDCYIQLASPGSVFWPGTDAEYTLYKHFEPGDTFVIDPPQIPAMGADSYVSQAINLAGIEDRVVTADNFVFQSP